ncbi:MAG: hypothetical protein IT572_05045 [Deltaproteobacteria bacterium]|nr:hypothetical protein [Deltaproteobacteria bacterium]
MAGGVRGGRGAREIVGIRESGHEVRPRVGLGSLPGELGAERRLPEFAEAEAAKRRFDARHREAVEYEFHRAFEVFHERKGPGLFPGKKGFLSLPGFREVSPAEFVNEKPKEKSGWTLEGLWNAVQRPEAMILFVPWVLSFKQGADDAIFGPGGNDRLLFLIRSLRRALDPRLTPVGDIYRLIEEPVVFSPPDYLLPMRAREGFSDKDTTAKDTSVSAPQGRDASDFARYMDSVTAACYELELHGFSVWKQLEFKSALADATAQVEGKIAAAPFFERERKLSEPSLEGEQLGISLPAYNAEIFWAGHPHHSWSLRTLHDRLAYKEKDPEAVHWIIQRGDNSWRARLTEIPLYLNDALLTSMQVKSIPGVVVKISISLQVDPTLARRVIVITEKFFKEGPESMGYLPTWGKFLIP